MKDGDGVMLQSDQGYPLRRPAGEVAVDGLLRGILAGIVMMALLIVLGWREGLVPSEVIEAFGTRTPSNVVNGLFSHIAISAIYGILWAFLLNAGLNKLKAPRWLIGMGYGLLLYGITRLLGPLSGLAVLNPVSLAVANIVYGAVLGLVSRGRG